MRLLFAMFINDIKNIFIQRPNLFRIFLIPTNGIFDKSQTDAVSIKH